MTKTAWVVECIWSEIDCDGSDVLAVSLTEDGAHDFISKYVVSEEYQESEKELVSINLYVTEVDLV